MTDEGECNIPDAFLKSAGIITHTMNESSEKIKEKKNLFKIGIFFKLGKKSPKFHWEMVKNSALENTKKSPDACLAGRQQPC